MTDPFGFETTPTGERCRNLRHFPWVGGSTLVLQCAGYEGEFHACWFDPTGERSAIRWPSTGGSSSVVSEQGPYKAQVGSSILSCPTDPPVVVVP